MLVVSQNDCWNLYPHQQHRRHERSNGSTSSPTFDTIWAFIQWYHIVVLILPSLLTDAMSTCLFGYNLFGGACSSPFVYCHILFKKFFLIQRSWRYYPMLLSQSFFFNLSYLGIQSCWNWFGDTVQDRDDTFFHVDIDLIEHYFFIRLSFSYWVSVEILQKSGNSMFRSDYRVYSVPLICLTFPMPIPPLYLDIITL